MSADKLFAKRRSMTSDPVTELATKVAQITAQRQLSDKSVGQLVVATENFGESYEQQVTTVYNNLETSLKSTLADLRISAESFQLEAAVIGGMMGADPQAAISAQPRQADGTTLVTNLGLSDVVPGRIATEAYDERENRNAQLNTLMFNLLAPRQDALGELFFPTIIVSPNEVGVTLAVKLFYVYNDFKRSANGALANINRKNIIRAYANTDILKNELTRGVPVLRTAGADANTDKFADVADVPAWTENLGVGVSVTTGALKPDVKVDLIGISQTNELLASGIMGPTDALDTYIKLNSVFFKVTDGTDTDIIRVAVGDLPQSTFTYAVQGNSRRMTMSIDSDSVVLGSSTVQHTTGGALDLMTELANHNARVQLTISGSASLDKGEGVVGKATLSLTTLRNAAGQLVVGTTFDSLAAKLATAETIGYTVDFFRANSNLRQRGQLVDTQTEFRTVSVPYRSPMGVLTPPSRASAEDTTALQTLINATGIRVSNEAVKTLMRNQQTMASYKAIADASGTLPEMTAIGHYHVNPVYYSETIDLAQTVDSAKSHEKLKDIRAALVEKIRYYANEMLRTSEYKAAAAVLTGNTNLVPHVIIGTDQVLENYLTADGDLRTLGDSMQVTIASSVAFEMKGKIVISFGVFDQARNTAVNPLNYGNMFYTPELVLNLPVTRDGQVSNELTVTPRFVHMQNLPVMTVLNVTGLPAVTGKVTLNMHAV